MGAASTPEISSEAAAKLLHRAENPLTQTGHDQFPNLCKLSFQVPKLSFQVAFLAQRSGKCGILRVQKCLQILQASLSCQQVCFLLLVPRKQKGFWVSTRLCSTFTERLFTMGLHIFFFIFLYESNFHLW